MKWGRSIEAMTAAVRQRLGNAAQVHPLSASGFATTLRVERGGARFFGVTHSLSQGLGALLNRFVQSGIFHSHGDLRTDGHEKRKVMFRVGISAFLSLIHI
ncbi:MAG: hypothetical protein N2688_12060, partial [Burkholderiaceae bacterium]|nr:hypothetical protein [Burkholderiaceae bacterium]